MKHFLKRAVFLICVFTVLIGASALTYAAEKEISLKIMKTYTNYDLDGDGRKDSFVYGFRSPDGGDEMVGFEMNGADLLLKLNGKISAIPYAGMDCEVRLLPLGQTETYLLVDFQRTMDDEFYNSLYVYRYFGSGLKKVAKPVNLGQCRLGKVSGSRWYFKTCKDEEGNPDLRSQVTFTFCYRMNAAGDKLTLCSDTVSCTPVLFKYTGKTFSLSSNKKYINKKGMKLRKGRYYRARKLYRDVKHKRYMVYLTRKGESGWMNLKAKQSKYFVLRK